MSNSAIGISYNTSEFFLGQFYEVWNQHNNESEQFWLWLQDPENAPPQFREEYVTYLNRFEIDVANDLDLQGHIGQYLRDLNSGKKVLILSHSQGNLYANNAYRYIVTRYPQYSQSIGIVGVAVPSPIVQDAMGRYSTSPRDEIINMVREWYPDTLPANTVDKASPLDDSNHSFIGTYLELFTGRIRSQMINRIGGLKEPEKAWECKEPEEIPVGVTTRPPLVQDTSATLKGVVDSGKMIAARFFYNKVGTGSLRTCHQLSASLPASGNFNMGEEVSVAIDGLEPGTKYAYRLCGRQGDRVEDGGKIVFRTAQKYVECNESLSQSGGTDGYEVRYGMGMSEGKVTVSFNAYGIPDRIRIYHGDRLWVDSGWMSGKYEGHFTYEDVDEHGPNLEVIVKGNADPNTFWHLSISCPQ